MADKPNVPKEGFSYPDRIGGIDLTDVVERTKDGGSTTLITGEIPTSGTSISLGGHEDIVPTDDFGLTDLQKYVHTPEHHAALTARPNRALGTWLDSDPKGVGQTFLDVSRVFKDAPRSNRLARISMVTGDQMGGYNLGTGVTEYNPLHPEMLARAGGDVVLNPGEAERYINSDAPIGSEVVWGETTTPRTISRGRGRKKQVVPAGQGTFIFTGNGQMTPSPGYKE